MSLQEIKKDIKKLATKGRAETNAWFFKTGPGEYGEGDKFVGLKVPDCRLIAKRYKDADEKLITQLLHSPIHEERLIALFMLVHNYEQGDDKTKKQIYSFYLKNLSQVNNWDLVDSSAHKIVGHYIFHYKNSRQELYKLAKSKNLWRRRVAIISTAYFIAQDDFIDTLKISEQLLGDKHDLIHKATGWMLREVGKRDAKVLRSFLDKHVSNMPRTMLRYAIEKLPEPERRRYLKK